MKIVVDAMGGDLAPSAPVRGAVEAVERYGCEVILTGREEELRAALRRCGYEDVPQGITIVNATEVVEMSDDPATAFKKKKDSSLTVGLDLLRDGEADGFVSAGSTGALLAGATLVVKRIRGIRRAAMAPVLPTAQGGQVVLLDCGANAECTAEYLLQFAYLGSYYASRVLGVSDPRVGLLNIGAEPEKGDALRLETYALLQKANAEGALHFVGNIEAKEALMGECDVLVADGFSGNVMLKTVEGVGKLMGGKLKAMFKRNTKTKLAGLSMRRDMREFKRMLDPNEVGGTAFLGISKPVIKAHGSSNDVAFRHAIRQAIRVAESGIIVALTEEVERMKVKKEEPDG